MIGQEKLRKIIEQQIEMEEFPRFSIIVGAEGSGKKTLTMAIAYALNCQRVPVEVKVDSIREMIHNAYTVETPTLYVILDGNMSNQAKNALLKVCEETPKNAYIVMLTSDTNILPTLKSRAGVYYMQPYTPNELIEYSKKYQKVNTNIVVDICETPGDVDKLCKIGADEFYGFVQKVVGNIADVSPANALKISEQIDVKGNDSSKYDMVLFLRAFQSVCGNELKKCVAENDIEGQMWYSAGIKTVSGVLAQTKITGINKGALFDIFILDCRRAWS